jgi:protein SCO1/2
MTKTKNNNRFLLGIAVAVLLPLSFFLIAKSLKKDHIRLPGHYLAEGVDSQLVDGKMEYDTIFHQIQDVELTNQLGQDVFLNKDLKGKIVIVNFFFTSCPIVCPKLTSNLTMLQRAFRKNPKMEFSMDSSVQLVSITVNPERDSFPLLRKYADRYGANHDRWWFLTGDKKKIYEFARRQLGVSVQPGDGGAEDFIHTESLVLLDQQRYIRGYYNGLDTAEISRCAYDVSLLTMEKTKERKHK